MYDKLADFEREMFDLQKNHRLNIRELLEEAELKMDMMKTQHLEEVHALVRNFFLIPHSELSIFGFTWRS